MSSIVQPDATNEKGMVLTCGLRVNGDRCAIVLPIAAPEAVLTVYNEALDAIESFETSVLPNILACITTASFCSFIQAEPMTDGRIPARKDFDASTHTGLVSGNALPSNTGALLVFYRDPAGTFGTRMRIGKNTIPGIGVSQVVGDIVQSTLFANLGTLADMLQNGWPSVQDAAHNWYRYLATPRPRTAGTPLHGVTDQQPRNYLATQKRRFIPRD